MEKYRSKVCLDQKNNYELFLFMFKQQTFEISTQLFKYSKL